MLNGMARDFSWTVSAREYLKIYEKVRASRHAVPDQRSHRTCIPITRHVLGMFPTQAAASS